MTSIARNLADGGGGGAGIDALHAITVDGDGMLTYSKVLSAGNTNVNLDIDLNNPNAKDVSSIDSNVYNYDAETGQNANLTDYDQYYFGSKDMLYFIDDEGYLVMRYRASYVYTGPK